MVRFTRWSKIMPDFIWGGVSSKTFLEYEVPCCFFQGWFGVFENSLIHLNRSWFGDESEVFEFGPNNLRRSSRFKISPLSAQSNHTWYPSGRQEEFFLKTIRDRSDNCNDKMIYRLGHTPRLITIQLLDRCHPRHEC